jgi:Acetyl/propionyl-CoA carboxylase, alpha subunit
MTIRFTNGTATRDLDLDKESGYEWSAKSDGDHVLRIGHATWIVDSVDIGPDVIRFRMNGSPVVLAYQDEQAMLLDKLGFRKASETTAGTLKAPMPGRILAMHVSVGDTVARGQQVAVLEAMKMENELRAPVDGIVAAVPVQAGQSVEKNTVIIEITPLG